MDTATAATHPTVGFLAYGEVVMAAPARTADLAHRPAYRWIAHPVPDNAPTRPAPTGTGALIEAQRTGRTLVRPACEPEPDPAETTATIGWQEADYVQVSAGWANYLHKARPCTAERCFPDGYPR